MKLPKEGTDVLPKGEFDWIFIKAERSEQMLVFFYFLNFFFKIF